jgi:sulfate adenylyltransferase subunit 2
MTTTVAAVKGGEDGTASPYALSHLDALESEAVHIFREVAGEFERPVILFSGGKDSIVMLHLALKAFAPAAIPFSLLHVDTGHNFPEVLEYRDRVVAAHGLRLHVASVQDYIDRGVLKERPDGTRNPLQTLPLTEKIQSEKFDAVFGGGRRDEEKARAKERVFSLQRPPRPRRARPRVPTVQLDRAGRLAVHRPRGHRAAGDLLRARARGLQAGRHVADRR